MVCGVQLVVLRARGDICASLGIRWPVRIYKTLTCLVSERITSEYLKDVFIPSLYQETTASVDHRSVRVNKRPLETS